MKPILLDSKDPNKLQVHHRRLHSRSGFEDSLTPQETHTFVEAPAPQTKVCSQTLEQSNTSLRSVRSSPDDCARLHPLQTVLANLQRHSGEQAAKGFGRP
jgi:hypothetical protein